MSTQNTHRVAVAWGDGIGPEITEAVINILKAAQAPLIYEEIQLGEQVYRQGHSAGIAPETWPILRRCDALLKAPITTPQGGGVKSLNVTLRKTLSLFSNVRPCRTHAPFVSTRHPEMDLVIIRENEEGLYAGIEHSQTDEVAQCLKLVSRPGAERIIRYAFEYARLKGRKRVTAMVKDNIMKITDGLFTEVFNAVREEYPDIESDRMIIDIGTARLADTPDRFDVVVLPNLYGDILSDVAAQLSGSVGLGGSANIGAEAAMFEAVHGSAPDIAGQNIANPSGLLHGAILMLQHLGLSDVAEKVHNAWLKTIEDGIHTGDIVSEQTKQKVGTSGFAQAVIARLGEKPQQLEPAKAETGALSQCVVPLKPRPRREKVMVGVDVFLDWDEADRPPENLGTHLSKANADGVELVMITNRGVKVWPGGQPETFCTDHWRCRFQRKDSAPVTHKEMAELLQRISALGLDWIKIETLCTFDGKAGFSLGQGQ
ncbi:MAG: NADP-dependent isocitrate dehydrogenase [Bradymonadia bacterium]